MNLRRLGIVTMLCAPAILVEALLNGFQRVEGTQANPFGPYLYLLFALGWFCGMLGLQQMRAAGKSTLSKIIVTLPLVTLPLAMLQSVLDLVSFNDTSVIYMVTDLAWPLSMLLTLIVGVNVLFTGTLKGWQRFVPFFCGLALPTSMVLGLIFGETAMAMSFPLHTALGWLLLGLCVYAQPQVMRGAAFAR